LIKKKRPTVHVVWQGARVAEEDHRDDARVVVVVVIVIVVVSVSIQRSVVMSSYQARPLKAALLVEVHN
jgi:hypothetical protein